MDKAFYTAILIAGSALMFIYAGVFIYAGDTPTDKPVQRLTTPMGVTELGFEPLDNSF